MSLADQACSNGLDAMRQGNLDAAESHFREALQKKFDHPKTRYFYGLMLQNQRRDPARAEELWKAVSMFQLKNRFHVQVPGNPIYVCNTRSIATIAVSLSAQRRIMHYAVCDRAPWVRTHIE